MDPMKATIQRVELLKALDRVRWTLSTNRVNEALTCFCFHDGLVTTYDGTAATETVCNMGGLEFCALGEKFFRLIYSLFDTIELKLENGRLDIKSGGNKTWMSVLPTDSFPNVVPKSYEKYCVAPNFLEAISAVSFSVGTNVQKKELLGLCMEGNYVYTSDGLRISRAKLLSPAGEQVKLNYKAIEQLIRLGRADFYFFGEGLFGGFYPATNSLYFCTQLDTPPMPTKTINGLLDTLDPAYTLDLPKQLAQALQRSGIFAKDGDPEVILESSGGELKLSSQGDIGAAAEALPWPGAPEFRVAVKPAFLQAALARTEKINLTDVVAGSKRMLRFISPNLDHMVALRVLSE